MVNPGILPLTLVRGTAFTPIILQCKDEKVTVSGTLNPNVVGLYLQAGTYNGYQAYVLEGSPATFLYVNPISNSYVIARLLTDGALTDYWEQNAPSPSDPSGTYAAHGANSGVATVDDNPVDLSGFTVEAQVRRTWQSDTMLIDLNPSITDALNGEITIPQIAAATTAALQFDGAYVWDLVLVDGTGERYGPFVRGAFTITDVVTQDLTP